MYIYVSVSCTDYQLLKCELLLGVIAICWWCNAKSSKSPVMSTGHSDSASERRGRSPPAGRQIDDNPGRIGSTVPISPSSSHFDEHDGDEYVEDDEYFENEFDYENQEFYPNPFTYTSRPQRYYIQEFNNGASRFPVQQVIANSDIAISTAQELNRSAGSLRHGITGTSERASLRSRSQSNTSRVRSVRSRSAIPRSIRSRSRSRRPGTASFPSSTAQSYYNGIDGELENDGVYSSFNATEVIFDDTDPDSIPIVVQPKVLNQNPITPTVLPSNYQPINNWTRLRSKYLKEFLAEFCGTMFMLFLGSATVCQNKIGGQFQKKNFNQAMAQIDLSSVDSATLQTIEALRYLITSDDTGSAGFVAMGWSAAGVVGYFTAGGGAISGAHLNPAITLTSFIFRGFPMRKVPIYWIAQGLGAFVGALTLYIFYRKVIREAYGENFKDIQDVANMFSVFPKDYLSTGRQFVSELFCTCILQAGAFALTDPYTALATDIFPVVIWLLTYCINISMSYQTGAGMNPTRDLGPRLALYAVGFNKHMLWLDHHRFFWVPIVAPFVGAILGALIYDVLIYQGHESPVNWPMHTFKELLIRTWHRKGSWLPGQVADEFKGRNGLDNIKLRRQSLGPQPDNNLEETSSKDTFENDNDSKAVRFKSQKNLHNSSNSETSVIEKG